jgi:GDPmannose 4,6-dehydratase
MQGIRILVIGSNGQTGSYLVENLLKNNYQVYGIARKKKFYVYESNPNYKAFYLKLDSNTDLNKILDVANPSIVINLASMSSVAECALNPRLSEEINFNLVKKICGDLMKFNNSRKSNIKLIQASSSEMYSANHSINTVRDSTLLNPGSYYGEHKALAHNHIRRLRTEGSLFTSSAILFNHESPRRADNFVSKKIANFIHNLKLGKSNSITFGNMQIKRDWGYAKDYAKIITTILENDKSDDFIVASGELHSVKEFLIKALELNNIKESEINISEDTSLFRNNDHPGLMGDMSQTKQKLGEIPHTSFENLIRIMCTNKFEK